MSRRPCPFLFFLIALVGLAMACQLPGTVGSTPTQTVTAPIVTAEPTVEPIPTEAASPSIGMGVHLEIPASIASGASVQLIPAPAVPSEGPAMDNYPDYLQVDLTGYVLSDTFHQPRINLYPVADTAARNEFAAATISELQTMLADRPADFADPMPFLPIFNAAQMMHAKESYLQSGTVDGVRYLTQYAQAPYPINSHDLFYTFQGFTADGATYVLAILPVSHPDLAATGDELPGPDYQDFIDNYETYTQASVDLLNGAEDASFTPSLADLDAMIQSLWTE